jgi:hypothetical protein
VLGCYACLCNTVRFCSSRCRVANWKKHKRVCAVYNSPSLTDGTG